MRLSSNQINQQGTQDMQRIARDVAKTQEQIASGRQISRVSDDPVGASKIIALRQEIAGRESYIRNADVIEQQLAEQENVLKQVIDVIQRVQELVLQANSGVLTVEDRRFIAAEIDARQLELNELMNARGTDGKYLFAGSKGDVQPFVADGRDVRYTGDEAQRRLQVDTGLFVPFSDSGRALFMDIPSAQPTFQVQAHPANQATDVDIHALGVIDTEALAEFAPEDVVIEFQPLADGGGEANFTVRRVSDNALVGEANQVFAPGDLLDIEGMRLSIDGVPQVGDRFVVRTTQTQSLLETVSGIATDLKQVDDAVDAERFASVIDNTIANLGNAQNAILQARSDIGARMNTVEATRDFHAEQNLSTQALLSKVQDLDYAEAVSRLSFQSFVLEAAQQSYVRISRLSLFNAL